MSLTINNPVSGLSLKKLRSQTNPLKMASHEVGINKDENSFRNTFLRGVDVGAPKEGSNTLSSISVSKSSQMQRAYSKQDYDVTFETAALRNTIH